MLHIKCYKNDNCLAGWIKQDIMDKEKSRYFPGYLQLRNSIFLMDFLELQFSFSEEEVKNVQAALWHFCMWKLTQDSFSSRTKIWIGAEKSSLFLCAYYSQMSHSILSFQYLLNHTNCYLTSIFHQLFPAPQTYQYSVGFLKVSFHMEEVHSTNEKWFHHEKCETQLKDVLPLAKAEAWGQP